MPNKQSSKEAVPARGGGRGRGRGGARGGSAAGGGAAGGDSANRDSANRDAALSLSRPPRILWLISLIPERKVQCAEEVRHECKSSTHWH